MQALLRGLVVLTIVAALLAGVSPGARARDESGRARQTNVVLVTENIGCREAFERLLCGGFQRALRVTGVKGRIFTPSPREDVVESLERIAKQRYDLVIVFGFNYYRAVGQAARRQPTGRFAIIDAPRRSVVGAPPNVHGVVFRTSEAAYLAGWLAARVAQRRPGPDVLGVVGGIPIPSVTDFVIGFRAGARRASPRIRLLTDYSQDFVNQNKCAAIARRQIARGAEVVFNVAGACGLGTLEAAKKAGVWGVGVDADQSFLGPHILTSVLKDYGAGFVTLFRRLQGAGLRPGVDTILTLSDGAVGLGKVNRAVPVSLHAELVRLERRIATGKLRVPGAHPNPR